jgi:hypothetical protein
MRNRWLVLAAALAASLSALLVALGTQVPASAASGTPQAGKLPVGNLLSYDNSDFEGHANFIPVTNIAANGITDSAAFKLHGKDALKFTATAAGTTVLKLQEGSSATQINVNGGKTYTLGGWFKLPATNNSGESITFGLGLYDSSGTWLGWSNTSALNLSATSNWQYVEGQITLPLTAAWALDSPEVTLSNAAMGQVTYMDMLVFEPRRAAQAIGAHGSCAGPTCSYSATDWINSNNAIGPQQTGKVLQSDKEFIDPSTFPPNGDLPSNFSQTICATIEKDLGSNSEWPVCIIAYTGTLSANDATAQADMNSFLSTVPAQQELYLVWQQEPEGKTFSNEPGCPTNDTNSQAFVCEFDRQAGFVHNSPNAGPNIFMAMDSGGSHYGEVTDDDASNDDTNSDGTQDPNTGAACPWMPPNSANGGADIYLVDFYQYSFVEGTDVNTEALREDNWKNWLSCATANNRPIGFGEYGLDQSTSAQIAPCTNNPNDAANAPNSMSADNLYLKNLPMSTQAELQNHVPVAMWDYWYSNYGGTPDCTVFTSSTAISTWQGIETANGGG